MIVILDVEPPFDEGVVTLTFAAGNNKGGVEIQTAEQDLQGRILTMCRAGNTPDDDTERMLDRIRESLITIMEEELGDVCEEV